MPSVAEPKACFSMRAKKIPNRVGARTQPCFTPLLTLKASEAEPSKTTVPLMPYVKRSDEAEQPG